MTWHKFYDRLTVALAVGCLIGVGLGVLLVRA
jgi:hypothetical protein